LSTPQPPSADQLASARLAHWRQNTAEDVVAPSASAILTIESARSFISTCGLLLFAPRAQHIPSPAPTFVEATLGTQNATPTLAESAVARTLLARLIAEGSAVPLNLLGAPSTTPDAPDFIASAAVFPYIFTLRGDKAWKQPPDTSGASKVSPLALHTYNLLLAGGPASASGLTTGLGKEVTEAAVLRSLNELWQHLRVLPVPQANGDNTLWETIAHRFTKQIKAGANAGQPTALSALISLYLSQSLLATEGDIETFLSPLAPRSRVRDVLHALTGARQLESIAVDGKTHLHIHGELPSFLAQNDEREEGDQAASSEQQVDGATAHVELAEDGSRIQKFVPKPRKLGTGYVERAKPFSAPGRPAREARSPAGASRPGDRTRPPQERDPRPFGKPTGASARSSAAKSTGRPSRPAFNKPWEEEKQERQRRAQQTPAAESASAPELTDTSDQQSQPVQYDGASAPAFRRSPASGKSSRPAFAAKPRFGGDRPAFTRKTGPAGDRPAYTRSRDTASEARPPRREFTPREGDESRPLRREFTGGKPPFGAKKPFGKPPFADHERRPFRRDASAPEGSEPRRPFTPRTGDAPRPPRRDFAQRSEAGTRPPREEFSKPRFSRDRPNSEAQAGSAYGERPTRQERPAFRKFDAPRKPFVPRSDGDSRPPRRDAPGSSGRPPGSAQKPYEPSRSSTGKREATGYAGKRDGSAFAPKKPFAAKSASFAGKKPFAKKPFSGKPSGPRGSDAPGASTFDKFKGGNKPWGKRPPGRKPKPDARPAEGEA